MQPDRRPREQELEAARHTAAVTIAMIAILRISTPKMSHGAWRYAKRARRLAERAEGESAMFWRMNATANVATSITAGECPRSGRKTSLSISSESSQHDAEAEEDRLPVRQPPLCAEGEREGAGHHQLPVGEVDEAEHAEDEADPHRHERVDAAERERVREHGPRRG